MTNAELRAVAEAATQSDWVATTDMMDGKHWATYLEIPNGVGAFLDWSDAASAEFSAQSSYEAGPTSQAFADITHAATFDPPTVLSLLSRLEAAEARAVAAEGQVAALIRRVDPGPPVRHIYRSDDEHRPVSKPDLAALQHKEPSRDS